MRLTSSMKKDSIFQWFRHIQWPVKALWLQNSTFAKNSFCIAPHSLQYYMQTPKIGPTIATRRTLGSFGNFGSEIQTWESTSSLKSKVVINKWSCKSGFGVYAKKYTPTLVDYHFYSITSWFSFRDTSILFCNWLILLQKW